ncbi:unnamed protein product [Brassica napus]|uniref:(rape) hypothetical protein n=1 Tax=Brassica napus TaxID=3708 RepID=A0A816JAK2_BRANA|nr:unnamed protein product [Brassica napus]
MDSDDHRPLKKRFVVGHQQAPQQAPQAPQQAPRQQALQQAPRQQARQQAPAQEEPPQEDPPQECLGRVVVRHQQAPQQARRQQAPHQAPRQQAPEQEDPPQGCLGRVVVRHQQAPRQQTPQQARRQQAPHQAPRQQAPEQEDPEEDANTAEPPPPLPCRYRSLRSLFKTCPLLGCFLKVEQNRSHCCYGHFQLAREFAQRAVAFHYFDGFLDGEHRKRVCILALLNSVRGLQTGVPNLDHVAGLFTTLPWQLKIIPENAGNWLFFKTPPLRYTSMSYTSTNCGTKPPAIWWKKNPFLSIGFEGFDHPPVKYTLFLMDGGDDHHRQLAKDWRLHLFQCQELSLYCLSTGGSLIFAQPEPKLVKKQNPGDGDTSPTDRDPNPVSKIASSKRHRNLPSTSNSSSVPQVPVGNPQGRGRNSMLSFLAVTEGVACRDGETVELQQIKAKKKIGPSFALKTLFQNCFSKTLP